MTSYKRKTGRFYSQKIGYLKTSLKRLPQWTKGMWLGKTMSNDFHIIGTPSGIIITRSIRNFLTMSTGSMVVQTYGSQSCPSPRFHEPFAPFSTLSHPTRIGTGRCYHVYSCAYFGPRVYMGIAKEKELEAFDKVVLQITRQRKHKLKQLWRVFEVATLEDKLDHFGPGWDPGRIRLSPTFREPFADFSPTRMKLMLHDRMTPIPIWDKLPQLLFNGCHTGFLNASVTAKCEYYHIHLNTSNIVVTIL